MYRETQLSYIVFVVIAKLVAEFCLDVREEIGKERINALDLHA